MKKLYIAPEVEIKRFNTEDIMANSGIEVPGTPATDTTYSEATVKDTVSYNDLFTL